MSVSSKSEIIKDKESADSGVVFLTNILDKTGRNNYLQWLDRLIDQLEPVYGVLAIVFRTNVAYVLPPVAAVDWTPVFPEEEVALAGAALTALTAKLREGAMLAWMKRRAEIVATHPKMYASIWATLSKESRQATTADGEYLVVLQAQDPNALFLMVRRIHFTAGDNAVTLARRIETLEQSFTDLRQSSGTSIHAFKTEFDLQLRTLQSVGVVAMPQDRLVIKFLNKLDTARHGAMVTQLENTQRAGGAFPATVEEAYGLAKLWKAPASHNNFRSNRMESAYLLADEMCFFSPPRAKPPAGDTSKPSAGDANKPSAGDAKKAPYAETRKCHICKQRGHLMAHCPKRDRSQEVFLAMGDEGGEVEEAALGDLL